MARVIGADGLVIVSSLTQPEAHDYLQDLTQAVCNPGSEFYPENPVDAKLYADKRAELVTYLKTFPVQI
jgi:hypothetical protein